LIKIQKEQQARKKLLAAVAQYCALYHRKKPYAAGDMIPYAGRIYDKTEMLSLVDASLDFWLTAGRYADKFEKELAEFLGVKKSLLVNSGSSANLLAFMTLTSPLLKVRAIKKGDEVITVAAGFPTTVAPIIQFGAVPVFIDVTLPHYNADVKMLKKALSKKTKAVMLAHTLGNPFDLQSIKDFCDKNKLWLIEDNCDSLGSRYNYHKAWKYTGTISDIGTSSFYPPHHMTMGEGGAVYTNNPLLYKIALSLRDWGRDCWCKSGKDNTCGKRFDGQFGELPRGYDHKYVYSHFGYNFKATEMQAAIGCAQLKKLPAFIKKRKENWKYLRKNLESLSDKLILPEPAKHSDPAWFGFLITVKKNAGIDREQIVRHLEAGGIQTRMLFAGNLIKHPCFDEMRKSNSGYRISGSLKNTDDIMNRTFWVGVYPGMTKIMLSKMVKEIKYACGL
jgi:CDP-6-deoxy-D-xylo-4-hexulose-3-dehydrase